MKEIFILITMIFSHIIDDYYLQGILCNLKQREFWEKNAPQEIYKNDYKVALIIHAFSWAFVMMIPIWLYLIINGKSLWSAVIMFVINIFVHAVADDAKANKRLINLVQDQMVHLIQIIFTWFIVL